MLINQNISVKFYALVKQVNDKRVTFPQKLVNKIPKLI